MAMPDIMPRRDRHRRHPDRDGRILLTDPPSAPKQGYEGAPDAGWCSSPGARGARRHPARRVADRPHLVPLRRARPSASAPARRPGEPDAGDLQMRSADRPNPIGLHEVEALAVEGERVHVRPLQAIDGTLVVDLKPCSRVALLIACCGMRGGVTGLAVGPLCSSSPRRRLAPTKTPLRSPRRMGPHRPRAGALVGVHDARREAPPAGAGGA